MTTKITSKKAADGIDEYTLTNKNGVTVSFLTLGCSITSIRTPNSNGVFDNIVVAFNNVDDYRENKRYFGCVVGRCANRIAAASFSLLNDDDGNRTTFRLAANNGINALHGGVNGFHRRLWTVDPSECVVSSSSSSSSSSASSSSSSSGKQQASVTLRRTSEDMEEGYPGRVEVAVTYTLDDDDALTIEYRATTDKKTIINLTNHSYFNLNDADDEGKKEDVLSHLLTINASSFTPINDVLIPTGDLLPVVNTPFDFTAARRIGDGIDNDHPQIVAGKGYDHNFVLNKNNNSNNNKNNNNNNNHHYQRQAQPQTPSTPCTLAAVLESRGSRRRMEVMTTQPGMQFYSGNFLDGSAVGNNGVVIARRSGLCLETQLFPDSVNRFEKNEFFPSPIVTPAAPYYSKTVLRFSVANA